MAFAGQTLVDSLARRLRDTSNVGYSRAALLDILNRCQRSLNAHLALVTNTATFVTADSSLYLVSGIATDIVRIIEVSESDRVLTKVPWDHLVHQDDRWLRMHGSQAEIFATVGRDILVVAPIPASSRTLTALYVKQTTNMADTLASFMELPDEHKSLLLDLAEAVMLFRGREFKNMQVVLGRVTNALGLEDVIQMERRGHDMTHE